VQAGWNKTVIGDTVNTAARLADADPGGRFYAGAANAAANRHVVSWRRCCRCGGGGWKGSGRGRAYERGWGVGGMLGRWTRRAPGRSRDEER